MVAKGYKNTEVGVIPEDWEVFQLKCLSEKIMVGIASAATHAYRNKGVILFRNQNIKPNYLDDSNILYISKEYEAVFKGKRLKGGDLLTARTGYPGTTCILPSKYENSQSFTTLITRPKPEKVNSRYLSYYINSEQGDNFFERSKIGGGQKNVNAGILKLMPIPLPPTKEEQQAIAKVLTDTDNLIAGLDKLIAKKKSIKKGAMQQLLTPPNKGGKRLSGFSGEWVEESLGEILKNYQLGGNYVNKQSRTDSPLIKMGNLNRGKISLKKIEYIPDEENAFSVDLLKFGDVLFNTRNTLDLVGKVAIWRDELPKAYFNSNIMRLEFKNEFVGSNFFMNNLFNTKEVVTELRGVATGTTSVAAIYTRDLINLKMTLPSPIEQQAIATILSDMDKEIEVLETKKEKYKQLKQGLAQELLTGKTRLV